MIGFDGGGFGVEDVGLLPRYRVSGFSVDYLGVGCRK